MIITKNIPFTKEEIKREIESLSMDLFRISMFYSRGSVKNARTFSKEAIKCINKIPKSEIEPYFVKILNKLPSTLSQKDEMKLAEDALMYSVLCRNYAKKFT